ncbi:MAG: tetratricopeptide repeat protein [Nitrospirae bacterium]|nr:MAG: tetratricopeptide repeat protein [Nitrospirota bacterium]
MQLKPFKCLIREKCGLSFDDSREAILTEGIKSRLSRRALASHEEYLDLLAREPHEFNSLLNLITVNETYFLRESVHFTLLTEKLLPDMLAGKKGGRIKIVCAGCSTGEEPYSIAMALMMKFGPAFSRLFSLVAFDIDEEALGKARAGLYPGHSFRGVPDHIQKVFFREQGNGFRINDAVREGVEFLRLNLFSDSYPETVMNADVIFYRNVSIYFEPGAQQRIFRNLAGMLNEKGYLFLSSAETSVHDIGVLSLIEMEGIYLYGKGVAVEIGERRKQPDGRPKPFSAAPPGVPGAAAAGTKRPVIRKKDEPHQDFDRALALAGGKKYDDALQLTERIIGMQPSFVKAHMLRAGILINLQRLDEAETVCLCGMGHDQWNLEGHLLLGLIARARGDVEEAKKRFKKAVYVKSSCWLAHFYLAEIYRGEGDRQPACREFEIVIKLLEEKGFSEHGLTFFSLSFPMEQVVHLCRHNLAEMKRGKA